MLWVTCRTGVDLSAVRWRGERVGSAGKALNGEPGLGGRLRMAGGSGLMMDAGQWQGQRREICGE